MGEGEKEDPKLIRLSGERYHPRLLNQAEMSQLMADRAMAGWAALSEEEIGGMVTRVQQRWLRGAAAGGGECRVLIKGVLEGPYDEMALRVELELGDGSVLYLVEDRLGGDLSDPRLGMVMVVRGIFPRSRVGARCVVLASAATWGSWGLSAKDVTEKRWPLDAVWRHGLGPGARRLSD